MHCREKSGGKEWVVGVGEGKTSNKQTNQKTKKKFEKRRMVLTSSPMRSQRGLYDRSMSRILCLMPAKVQTKCFLKFNKTTNSQSNNNKKTT
jgi:hypothetical protein